MARRILSAGLFFPFYAALIVWGFWAGPNLPSFAGGILAILVIVNIVHVFWPTRRIEDH